MFINKTECLRRQGLILDNITSDALRLETHTLRFLSIEFHIILNHIIVTEGQLN